MGTWKHGAKWRYKFQWQGQPIRSEKGYETQAEARAAEAEKKTELNRIGTIRMDFVKLCENRLNTLLLKRDKSYYSDNKQMIEQLILSGWATKKHITSADCKTFLDHIAASVSPQRANKYRAYMVALFNSEKRYRGQNPARETEKYPEDKQHKYIPPEEDILKVMAACSDEQRDYLWTLALTAARCREINNLKVEDVRPDLGYLTLSTRKAKDGTTSYRRITIGKSLGEIVGRRLTTAKDKKSEYLFFNARTETKFNYRSKFLKNKCEKAQVKEFTYHALRHYTAILLDRGGAPLTDIQKILGHQRATTTDIYLSSIRAAQSSSMDIIEDSLAEMVQKSKGKK